MLGITPVRAAFVCVFNVSCKYFGGLGVSI